MRTVGALILSFVSLDRTRWGAQPTLAVEDVDHLDVETPKNT
jgi:hypothetical protein